MLARMVEDAGAAAVAVHGRTAAQSYTGSVRLGRSSRASPRSVAIPVFGSGDCVEPEHDRRAAADVGRDGVLVGRGVLRNPWILAQAPDLLAGRPCARVVTMRDRGAVPARLHRSAAERARRRGARASGTRRRWRPRTPRAPRPAARAARAASAGSINKLRALKAWYTKGLDGGSHLRIRDQPGQSIGQLRDIIQEFFVDGLDHAAARDHVGRRGARGESPAACKDASARVFSPTAPDCVLAVRVDGRCIPAWRRCSSVKYFRYSPSSRLAIGRLAHLGATPEFHHGLLDAGDQPARPTLRPRRRRRSRRPAPRPARR